ncbi:two-component regulator propeller domain-containing protein [Cytophagaceae bacterium DM2B3-1]|uniref:histidine kinase n=1 Tax=Xanthocytophaga flava TaxID=3048013 RepID=A0ABT7CNJ7_9BACT|nr:two-component regulator propeller domain-containing protein [Xanthocytophaga flavus]MDJ1495252.1 two-component regulator propeller domain-containing protein [Xanthocytophaga flavus]
MKYLVNYILCFLCICCIVTEGFPQNSPEEFKFEHITVNEGLAHSDAMTVAQDKQGFIWVGTNKGINRYDGYTLKKYDLPLNDQTGLASNRIKALYVSTDGSLWVGTERAGLFRYDAGKDTFVNIKDHLKDSVYHNLASILSASTISSITSDSQGRLWVGTARYGVFMIQVNNQNFITNIRQIHLKDPSLKTTSPYDYSISRIIADKHNTLWIGTISNGLWKIQIADNYSVKISLQATKVNSISAYTIRSLHMDRRGDLWLGTGNQVLWISSKHLSDPSDLQAKPLQRTFGDIESLYLDSFNRLWVGTNFGLLLVGAGVSENHRPPVNESMIHTFLPLDTDPYSINSVRVHEIMEDCFHNLWLATSAGGLNQLKLTTKSFYQLRRQLSGQDTPANNYINAIYQDTQKKLVWIGTRNGFATYNFSQKRYTNYLNRALSGDVNGIDVTAFYERKDGTIWIGTRFLGVYILSNQNTLQKLPALPANETNWNNISIEKILEDTNGYIWIATFNAGLLQFTPQGTFLTSYSLQNKKLPTDQLTALLYEKDTNILWISTRDAGLLKTKLTADSIKILHHFQHEPNNTNSLQTNYIWPLLKDKKGNLWIGTIGGGLHLLTTNEKGTEVIKSYSQWVPETDVESLLADEAGNLWIGGAGLYQFNPSTKRLIHYDVSDGLQSNSFKVGAAFHASDSTMYFGGTNGITYFRPQSIQDNPYPPLVQITGLRIMNHLVSVGDSYNDRVVITKPFSKPQTIELKASENDFSIEFAGINYDNPQKHQYAYMLKGYNSRWVYAPPGQRTASFSNLPAGTYRFIVKASNGDGIWSNQNTTLAFTILPPWWRTWWAYILYACCIVGALALYRRITLKQQELKNKLAFEHFQYEKEKEVNDLKLRFFTNVSHELRTPLTLILGPMEELVTATGKLTGLKDKVLLMHKQTRKLLDLVNQLLDFRKVESGNISLKASRQDIIDFLTETFLIFKLKAEELNLDYQLAVPSHPAFLYFDRSKMEIILTNLLSNALKYTPSGGKIVCSATIAGNPNETAIIKNGDIQTNYLLITIQDWGIGMKEEEVDKIFDPYYQASQTETLRMMGTGIGLSLVKQLVERHSGKITVKSQPGAGTLFTIKMPFGKDHLAPDDIRNESVTPEAEYEISHSGELPVTEQLQTSLPGSLRILLVEDNEDVLRYLQQMFESNFEILTAPDGHEGWITALDTCPDLIISDVMMPRSDGMELCKKVKQHPKTMHIPVILLTARASAVHELEGLETGADDYIIKPFNPNILYAKADAILRNRLKLRTYYQRQILLEPTEVVIPDEDKQFLEKAMKIVESRLSEQEFNVQILVQEMGMSQSVFYRRIKSITGQTVVEFIRDIRMKRAAQLLAHTTLRISEIAFEVGIEDNKYFRQSFQKIYNMTPSEYAKLHRRTEKEETNK